MGVCQTERNRFFLGIITINIHSNSHPGKLYDFCHFPTKNYRLPHIFLTKNS